MQSKLVFVCGFDDRTMRQALVAQEEGRLCELEMLADDAPAQDTAILVHYFEGRRFLRREATVTWSHGGRHASILLCEREVNAETRRCFRVGALGFPLWAEINSANRGSVADVGAEGMALRVRRRLDVETLVDVRLAGMGRDTAGAMTVRSCYAVDDGSFRLGLQTELGTEFQQELEALSVELQRSQLAVRAGVG